MDLQGIKPESPTHNSTHNSEPSLGLLRGHRQFFEESTLRRSCFIAVTLGGESRAYPIREMGYHHVVNDRLHGLPIVVTY